LADPIAPLDYGFARLVALTPVSQSTMRAGRLAASRAPWLQYTAPFGPVGSIASRMW
jgi:hypothetical protein